MPSQNEKPQAGGPGASEKQEKSSLCISDNPGRDGSQAPRIQRAAHAYYLAGLSVVPASSRLKHPTMPWTRCRTDRLRPAALPDWRGDAVFVVCGAISGNLEILDFDDKGSRFAAWCALVEQRSPSLLPRLVVERSPSGGRHVFYRCRDVVIPKGVVLARKNTSDSKDCLIELRGEKDGAVVYPSPGYEIVQGRISQIPCISREEREVLICAAYHFNDRLPTKNTRAWWPK